MVLKALLLFEGSLTLPLGVAELSDLSIRPSVLQRRPNHLPACRPVGAAWLGRKGRFLCLLPQGNRGCACPCDMTRLFDSPWRVVHLKIANPADRERHYGWEMFRIHNTLLLGDVSVLFLDFL